MPSNGHHGLILHRCHRVAGGLVVFDGRNGDGKTYIAREMQRRLADCKARFGEIGKLIKP